MTKPSKLSHAAPIFPVSDVEATIEYYEKKLGFECTFRWGSPTDYAVMKRGESVSLHFTKKIGGFSPSPYHASLMVFVFDVDAIYAEFQEKEVNIIEPLGNRIYGTRDFDIKDLNGYIICFGRSLLSS